MLDTALALHPSVALRPEPFGALAYHYDNRRLVFLKHPTIVTVVEQLANFPSLRSTLNALGIDEDRWPAYDSAICSLVESNVVIER